MLDNPNFVVWDPKPRRRGFRNVMAITGVGMVFAEISGEALGAFDLLNRDAEGRTKPARSSTDQEKDDTAHVETSWLASPSGGKQDSGG